MSRRPGSQPHSLTTTEDRGESAGLPPAKFLAIMGGGLLLSALVLFIATGSWLVALAFIVYDRALASESIPMVDDSRSAKVFASFQDNLDAQIPTDAPGWIVARYNDLTEVCVAGSGVDPAPAPATNG